MTCSDLKSVPTWKFLAGWLPCGALLLGTAWSAPTLWGQNPRKPELERGSVRKPAGAGTDRERILKELQPGLSVERVRELLGGPPHRRARQVLHLRFLEQWVYDVPFPVCVEIEHPRGRMPQLLTVHPLTSEKP